MCIGTITGTMPALGLIPGIEFGNAASIGAAAGAFTVIPILLRWVHTFTL